MDTYTVYTSTFASYTVVFDPSSGFTLIALTEGKLEGTGLNVLSGHRGVRKHLLYITTESEAPLILMFSSLLVFND